MPENISNTPISQVRHIDNVKRGIPLLTTVSLILLAVIGYWFFKGGSFRLYASLFFGLYFLTQSSWLSIILVSVAQNIFFLPLRIIGNLYHHDIKDFEHELAHTKDDDQYFLLNEKVRKGDPSVIFYIINFVLLAMAFISAGRVFLLEFYHSKIDPWFLYSFIPYPTYPLKGVTFYFPFVKLSNFISLDWSTIFLAWGYILLFFIAIRLFWNIFLKRIFGKNRQLLSLRVGYNKILLFIGGFAGTVFVISLFALRHIPTAYEFIYLSADLSKQNTAFNIVTAICTFFATIKMGYDHNSESAHEARIRGIPENIVSKVFNSSMKITFRNAILLSVFAYEVTHMMPCSHDLSVLSFEFLYIISPITFDRFMPKTKKKSKYAVAENNQ